ncbi:MAG: phytase [Pseudomonadota bacterium]
MLKYVSLAMLGFVTACATGPGEFPDDPNLITVTAAVETVPVKTKDDAADDPAIWVHPTNSAKSLILGTDKKAGLYSYNLQGEVVHFLPLAAPNNVDLRQNIPTQVEAMTINQGTSQTVTTETVDIAVTSNRDNNTIGILSVTEAGTDLLTEIPTARPEPYGICMGYEQGRIGQILVAVTHKSGNVDLYIIDLEQGALGQYGFSVDSQPEGCVFDEANGTLYVGEEAKGIHAFQLEDLYRQRATSTLVDDVAGPNGITADIEGLTIYQTGETSGYLIASSQGNHSYAIYDRESRAFLGRFAVVPGETIDGAQETDGLDATSARLGPNFPNGVLVVQDGYNRPRKPQNFKVISWNAISEALNLSQ